MYPYPLGLPKSSVRATLTLILSVNFIWLTIDESELAGPLSTIVAVSLSFYFGGRMRGKSISPTTSIDRSQRAWGLPAGTIRLILILLFGGATYYVFSKTDSVPDNFTEVINLILGYLLGQFFTKMRVRFFGRDEDDKAGIVDHLKAILAVAITGLTFYITVFEDNVVDAWILTVDFILLSSIVLGFYFGARK